MANVYWHLMIASFCNSFHLFIHHWKWFQKFPFLVEYFAYDNLQYTLCVWMLTKQWFWLSIFESRQCCCCLKITQEMIWHLKNKILETIWFFSHGSFANINCFTIWFGINRRKFGPEKSLCYVAASAALAVMTDVTIKMTIRFCGVFVEMLVAWMNFSN